MYRQNFANYPIVEQLQSISVTHVQDTFELVLFLFCFHISGNLLRMAF